MIEIEKTKAIAELKRRWPELKHNLDRADAIFPLHLTGISLRRMARELNCSDKTLRNLLRARLAPPENRRLARQGKTSMRALVRMAAGKELPQTPRSNEAAQFERTKTASHVSHVIRDWIERTGLNKALQLRAIDQAQYVLRRAERNGTLPRGEVPRDLSEADIIMHCYPTDPKPHDSDALAVVSWYGRWMAIAIYHLLPEERGWDEALSMLIRELKRK